MQQKASANMQITILSYNNNCISHLNMHLIKENPLKLKNHGQHEGPQN